jgi:hypothetical protein
MMRCLSLSKRSARDMPADPAAGEKVGPDLAPGVWLGVVVVAGVRGRRSAGGDARRGLMSLVMFALPALGGGDVRFEAER